MILVQKVPAWLLHHLFSPFSLLFVTVSASFTSREERASHTFVFILVIFPACLESICLQPKHTQQRNHQLHNKEKRCQDLVLEFLVPFGQFRVTPKNHFRESCVCFRRKIKYNRQEGVGGHRHGWKRIEQNTERSRSNNNHHRSSWYPQHVRT